MTKVIGLIEGGGTGTELSCVFQGVIEGINKKSGKQKVVFASFLDEVGYSPQTFWEIRDIYRIKPYHAARNIMDKEVKDIMRWNDSLLERNCVGIFRTAINAETLYLLRKQVKSVKVVPVTLLKDGKTIELLFIRDQIQGFYANDELTVDSESLKIQLGYSLSNFKEIVGFYKHITDRLEFKPEKLLFLYKYHIVGLELEKMIDTAVEQTRLNHPHTIYQPDSGLHYLLHDIWVRNEQNRIAVICGNEIGDMLLEVLIHFYGIGTKETTYTVNHLLAKGNLEALQTMHGSADDIAGRNVINPTATLKAAGYALEKWLNIDGAQRRLEQVLQKAAAKNIRTSDAGGASSTREVTDWVIAHWN